MSADVFGSEYAMAYDAMYAGKNYGAECTALTQAMLRRGFTSGARVLDVGCGTGRHAARMAELGFDVAGTDQSDAMLDIARGRSDGRFRVCAGAELDQANAQFDVVYSLFDVLSYQTDRIAALKFLEGLVNRARPGGLVIVDAWHLAGLIAQPPIPKQRKEFEGPEGKIIRSSSSEIEWVTATTRIDYVVEMRANGKDIVFCETHYMRAFSMHELLLLGQLAGLVDMQVVPSPDLAGNVTTADWHVALIGHRV